MRFFLVSFDLVESELEKAGNKLTSAEREKSAHFFRNIERDRKPVR